MSLSTTLVAALSWDPQIRGALIVLTSFVILPGSVYLLLATNTGAKLGFLLAAAGLTGWMAVMGWIWVVYGIGIKGAAPAWHPEEVVTGEIAREATLEATEGFPAKWRTLPQGDPVLGDATAAADAVLAPSEGGDAAHGGGEEANSIDPVFEGLDDYVLVGGYAKGGENFWIPGGGLSSPSEVGNPGKNPFAKLVNRLQRGPFHAPHYAVIQVRPVIEQAPATGGAAPPRPVPDLTKPVTSVVMVRDLGSLRFPSLMVAISMSIVFALVANALHRRDKQVMAARAAAPAAG